MQIMVKGYTIIQPEKYWEIINMQLLETFIKNKRFALIFFLIIIIAFGIFLSTTTPERRSVVPGSNLLPTPFPLRSDINKIYAMTRLQKTTIGKTTDADIEKLFGIGEKTTKQDITAYILPSPVNLLPNEVQTKNGVVIFERIITPKDKSLPGFVTLSVFTDAFDKPQEVVFGSKTYGGSIKIYIYASRGLTVFANQRSDIVYEIHRYAPTTVNEYKNSFGNDLEVVAPEQGETL